MNGEMFATCLFLKEKVDLSYAWEFQLNKGKSKVILVPGGD